MIPRVRQTTVIQCVRIEPLFVGTCLSIDKIVLIETDVVTLATARSAIHHSNCYPTTSFAKVSICQV